MPRKQPVNSVAAALKAAVNAAKPLPEPPKNVRMRPEDRPFWESIMASRAHDEWLPADLVIAAQLARCQADIERESSILDTEGPVVENQRGTPIANPRHSVLETLSRRQLAMMKTLAMHAAVKRVDTKPIAAERLAEAKARNVATEVTEDELLA